MNSAVEPTAGFFRMRLVHGGPVCGVRIWHGPPLEPWTREPMDRGHRWNAEVNRRYIEVDRVWPVCLKDPIDEAEYEYLSQLEEYARKNDGFHPSAQPTKAVNWDISTPPF